MTAHTTHYGVGTISAYTKGCRCQPCRDAGYRKAKRYRHLTAAINSRPTKPLTVPVEPVIAHIGALVESGWRLGDIAREVGITPQEMWRIRHLPKRIHRDRAARILDLAPLAPVEVDEVVVERLAVAGVHWRDVPCTRPERVAAWSLAVARGEGPTRAADRLGLATGRDVAA